MLIRHPTSGLFWSVTDTCELSLSKEGSDYVKSTCGVPPHVATWDQNTSHLKNTVTGKCICRMGDKLVEADHRGIANGLFEWTIVDGMIQSYLDKYVHGDLSLVDKTSVQWNVADSFDEVTVPVVEDVTVPEEDEEVPALVSDDEEDVPVSRVSALIEEALNAQAAEAEVTPEIEQVIAETVAEVLAPIEEEAPVAEEAPVVEEAPVAEEAPVVEEASTDEVEA